MKKTFIIKKGVFLVSTKHLKKTDASNEKARVEFGIVCSTADLWRQLHSCPPEPIQTTKDRKSRKTTTVSFRLTQTVAQTLIKQQT